MFLDETDMSAESLKDAIRRELPDILRSDPEFRAYILDLARAQFADKAETQDRFYELLGELRRERETRTRELQEYKEEQQLLREEQNRKWEEEKQEQARKWEENNGKWDESNRKWEENNLHWKEYKEEQARKWAENNLHWKEYTEDHARKWEENDRRWLEAKQEQQEYRAETREEFRRVHEEIMAQAKKFDRSIGALGARWGMRSEKAFRDALAGILEESFGVQVINVNEFDDEGEVFGRPDQIELDVIIKNGLLLICELKSSIDKAGMYSFERKARFYERRHGRLANRLIVISPMIDPRAEEVARQLGIETFGDSTEVKSL